MIDYSKRYKFELNLGYKCNFNCKYCFEPATDAFSSKEDVTEEELKRFAKYIHHIKQRLDPSYTYTISVYGGEPTLYLDKLILFLRQVQMDVTYVDITTNGSLVQTEKVKDKLLFLKQMLPTFHVNVSYDYVMQDEVRVPGTYALVRDNIRWLYENGLCRRTTTVFSDDTIPRIADTFFDFIELKNELPEMKLIYNLARGEAEFAEFNEEATREALGRVRDYIGERPGIEKDFMYNPSVGYRCSRLKHALFGNIVAAMCSGGFVYPGYDLPFMSEYARKTCCIGNIRDDFTILEQKREELLRKFNVDPPQKCYDCGAVCRVVPWIRMVDNESQYNQIPDEYHCRIHRLVSEYLPYERRVYND